MRTPDLDLGGYCCAIQKARLVLRRAREERREAVREYVGNHWSEDGTDYKVPVNLLSLFCSIIGPKLISNHPSYMLSTMNRAGRPAVATMEGWVNRQVEKINLKDTLQRNAIDALFSVGIGKVAIAGPGESAVHAWNMKAGQPFADWIDLDDFVFDIHARSLDQVGYIGHRVRMPLDVVRESKIYGAGRKDLTASADSFYNLEGDERISMLGRGYYSSEEEYEDFVDLWEIYIPRHRVIVTLADDNLVASQSYGRGKYAARALREQKWIGPDKGPYHILAMGLVPGNALPNSPIQRLIDLHMPVNNIMRKQIAQAARQRSNLFYAGSATEDAQRVTNASDGDAIRVDDPTKIVEVKRGGPDPGNYTLGMQLKELFSWAAGGLDIIGGLAPQSRTAHQDEMLNQNSAATLSDMQQKTVEHAASVGGALCWFYHHHPDLQMESEYSPRGTPELSVTRKLAPQQRHAIPWDQIGLQVDPYTLQHQTPEQRDKFLDALVAQLAPMMQLLQQQGIMFDVNAWLRKKGRYRASPDLDELFTIQEPPPTDAGSSGTTGSMMPSDKKTEITRRSLGGDSQQAKQEGMAATMEAAASSQNGQMAGA